MTDPNAGQVNWEDQTIPLVPDGGYAQPDLQPLPEETLVDPAPPADPWASGPGLGASTAPDLTLPLPTTPPATATPVAPSVPAPQPASYPPPATASAGYGTPADYSRSTTWAPAPMPAPSIPTPAATYNQLPYADAFPEPDGPAATIPSQPPYQTYATSGYAGQGQAWPAVVDPVNYDYGYRGGATTPHPNAGLSMVLGILGIVAFGPLAPIAWYLAARGRREMAYDPARWRPSGMLTSGLVLGIIGTCLLVLGGLFILFIFGTLAAVGGR